MNLHCPVILLWIALLGSPLSAAPSPQPPHYRVTDLGVELRTGESGPAGINEAGDIAGTLEASPTSGEHRAFLFHRGKITLLSGLDLRAAALNNHGQVACFSRSAAFLWEKGRLRPLTPLPSLFGGFGGRAGDVHVTGLNDEGQVIGNVFGLDGVFQPFLWQDGGFAGGFPQRSDQLTPFPPFRFEPRAINDRGQIAGFTHGSRILGQSATGILWDGGKVRETASGAAVFPYALNNRGQMAGMMYVGTNTHAFSWDGSGPVTDLGTAGGSRSEAAALNDQGQIVGTADIQYEETHGLDSVHWGGPQAILWQGGLSYNLNGLLPTGSGWILERAVAINGRGCIVATGHRSRDGRSMEGLTRMFLLTPTK